MSEMDVPLKRLQPMIPALRMNKADNYRNLLK
jgi:hypothetical protein